MSEVAEVGYLNTACVVPIIHAGAIHGYHDAEVMIYYSMRSNVTKVTNKI